MDKALTAPALVKDRQGALHKALAHLDNPRKVRWVQTALQVAARTDLRNCDPQSVFQAVYDVAVLGLDISPNAQQAAIVKFGREAKLLTMYKGRCKLIDDRHPGASIQTGIVYEGDYYEETAGSRPSIVHRPNWKDADRSNKPMLRFYCTVRLPNGAYFQDAMDMSEILKTRNRSRGYQNAVQHGKPTPWHSDFGEMARKTVLIRTSKPISTGDRTLDPRERQVQDILAREEQEEYGQEPREAEWRDVSGEQAADAALERAEAAQGAREEPSPAAEPDRAAEAATEPESDPDGDLFDQAVADPEECTACGAPGGEPHRAGCDAPPF